MEFNGTKGEWYSIGNYIGVKNKKTRITHVTGSYPISDEEDSENARLMATAPELLLALKDLVWLVDNHASDDELRESINMRAKQAIAKALQP